MNTGEDFENVKGWGDFAQIHLNSVLIHIGMHVSHTYMRWNEPFTLNV